MDSRCSRNDRDSSDSWVTFSPKRHDRTQVYRCTDRIIPKGRLRGRSPQRKCTTGALRTCVYVQNAPPLKSKRYYARDEVRLIMACRTIHQRRCNSVFGCKVNSHPVDNDLGFSPMKWKCVWNFVFLILFFLFFCNVKIHPDKNEVCIWC